MNKEKIKKQEVGCKFVTVWDNDDKVVTIGKYDSSTGGVESNIISFSGMKGTLLREYIILEDGTEINVCMECHEYITDGGELCKECIDFEKDQEIVENKKAMLKK